MAVDNKYGQIHIERIQKDEPIFIFRASDVMSTYPLAVYRDLMECIGNSEGKDSVNLAIKRFQAWQHRRLPTQKNSMTKKEAVKFHEWLSNPMTSNHKWEILGQLDKIIGHCPSGKKKEVMNGRCCRQTGGGET